MAKHESARKHGAHGHRTRPGIAGIDARRLAVTTLHADPRPWLRHVACLLLSAWDTVRRRQCRPACSSLASCQLPAAAMHAMRPLLLRYGSGATEPVLGTYVTPRGFSGRCTSTPPSSTSPRRLQDVHPSPNIACPWSQAFQYTLSPAAPPPLLCAQRLVHRHCLSRAIAPNRIPTSPSSTWRQGYVMLVSEHSHRPARRLCSMGVWGPLGRPSVSGTSVPSGCCMHEARSARLMGLVRMMRAWVHFRHSDRDAMDPPEECRNVTRTR